MEGCCFWGLLDGSRAGAVSLEAGSASHDLLDIAWKDHAAYSGEL